MNTRELVSGSNLSQLFRSRFASLLLGGAPRLSMGRGCRKGRPAASRRNFLSVAWWREVVTLGHGVLVLASLDRAWNRRFDSIRQSVL